MGVSEWAPSGWIQSRINLHVRMLEVEMHRVFADLSAAGFELSLHPICCCLNRWRKRRRRNGLQIFNVQQNRMVIYNRPIHIYS
jgi:hypothetical protein